MTSAGDNDFEWMMRIFREVCSGHLGSSKAWAEEEQRQNPGHHRWPLPTPKNGYENLMRILGEAAFYEVMDAIKNAEGVDVDPSSDRFQVILRMVHRAVDITVERCGKEIGFGRISGMRDFKNKVKAHLIDEAIRSGQGVKVAGISKSAAYRALGRKGAKQ